MKNILVVGAGSILLAGCGGGSGVPDPGEAFMARAEQAQLIYDQTTSMAPTDPGSMRDGVTASYSGVASALATLPEGDTEALYADVDIAADFTLDTFTGDMTNWQGNTLGSIDGSVAITGGAISGADWTASGDGTLSADGETGTVAVTMDGSFLGADGSAMQGTFFGDIAYSGAPTGSIVGSVDALESSP